MPSTISHMIHWGTHLFDEKSFVYVALGDSTAEGIGASSQDKSYTSLVFQRLQKQYKNLHFYNFGKNSSKSRNVLESQIEKAVQKQPDLITLSVGANDIRFGVTIRTFSRQMREILVRLQTETTAHIVVASIPDFSEVPRVPKLLKRPSAIAIRRYNAALSLLTDELGIAKVDVFPQNTQYFKIHPEAIAQDGFHPSDFGYTVWADAVVQAIQEKGIIT